MQFSLRKAPPEFLHHYIPAPQAQYQLPAASGHRWFATVPDTLPRGPRRNPTHKAADKGPPPLSRRGAFHSPHNSSPPRPATAPPPPPAAAPPAGTTAPWASDGAAT